MYLLVLCGSTVWMFNWTFVCQQKEGYDNFLRLFIVNVGEVVEEVFFFDFWWVLEGEVHMYLLLSLFDLEPGNCNLVCCCL